MVPDPRSWLRGPLRVLRASRALALALGVAVGVGALSAAAHYAQPSLYEYVLLPLGVGGSVYYAAHYDLSGWEQDALARGFLRNFAIGLLATSLVTETQSFADGLVSTFTVISVVLLAVLTAVVDAVGADGDDDACDGEAGDGGAGDDERWTSSRRPWKETETR